VYSDYNNGDHGACGGDNQNPACIFIEANTFKEQVVGAVNVGQTWVFQFDALRGNIEGVHTARAFIKTLDPNAGFSLSNFISVDMTDAQGSWNDHLLSIYIDPGLVGQILQFGFLSYATNYEGSGIFYDNIAFTSLDDVCPSDDDGDDEGGDGGDDEGDDANISERVIDQESDRGNRDLTSRW